MNSSDRNFTDAKFKRRMEEIEASIGRSLAELDSADRRGLGAARPKCVRLKDNKSAVLKLQVPR